MPRRLAVVAGAGVLAPQVVAAAMAAGDTVKVFALTAQPALAAVDFELSSLEHPEAMFTAIRSFGATHLTLAGAVTLGDAGRHRIIAALGGVGAPTGDAALSSLATALQRLTGALLLGPHEIAPDLLASAGLMAGPDISPSQLATAKLAMGAAWQIGKLDLGQAAVVSGGRVIAVEDVGGTEELLSRVAGYRAKGLVTGTVEAPLVLAKACKPQQPLFVDLPAIGPNTVAQAGSAGISVIAVEAGKSLVLDRRQTVELADQLGIGILGLSNE